MLDSTPKSVQPGLDSAAQACTDTTSAILDLRDQVVMYRTNIMNNIKVLEDAIEKRFWYRMFGVPAPIVEALDGLKGRVQSLEVPHKEPRSF